MKLHELFSMICMVGMKNCIIGKLSIETIICNVIITFYTENNTNYTY
ncbi:hypothetical protein [Ichthyenterobacterium magnum]|nr:hypothetical protein [Ichthyenterobacterium magnum]